MTQATVFSKMVSISISKSRPAVRVQVSNSAIPSQRGGYQSTPHSLLHRVLEANQQQLGPGSHLEQWVNMQTQEWSKAV